MMSFYFLAACAFIPSGFAAALQDNDFGYTREQLQPLTKFRQQHRRTIDGRLCAAAFVQNRKAYTDCTDAPSPAGDSGRPWCYVEAQLLDGGAAWNYCVPGALFVLHRGGLHLLVLLCDKLRITTFSERAPKIPSPTRLGKCALTCRSFRQRSALARKRWTCMIPLGGGSSAFFLLSRSRFQKRCSALA